jgi:hydrogenase expression/formation protein HypE
MSEGWNCPLPLRDYDKITIGHGGGGELTADLIEHLFLPAFAPAARNATPTDAAVMTIGDQRLAFTTDSYVVHPLFFPGGNIGELAVHGTVNDLAMAGARPLALSTAFILEEGLDIETLAHVAQAMGEAATQAGVELITGDTKVVDAGLADGMYITTTGVGLVPEGVDIRPQRATPGDQIILSGPIGLHGIAVLSVRDGLEFGTALRSDSAPLNHAVASMVDTGADIHVMRDLTRGGLATAMCEIATTASVGLVYDEAAVPVPREVRAACGFLGLDPVHVANEGKLIAIVSPSEATSVLEALRAHDIGVDATIIGEVTEEHPGVVIARTAIGAQRIIDRPLGEQLPRIC